MMMDQQEGSRKVRCILVRNNDDDDCNDSVTSFTSTVSGITLDTSFDESVRSFYLSSSLRFPTTTLMLLEEEQENDTLPPIPPKRMPSHLLHTLHNDKDECIDEPKPRPPSRPEEVDGIDSSFKFKPSFVSPIPVKKPLRSPVRSPVRFPVPVPVPVTKVDIEIDSSFKFKPPHDASPEPAKKPLRLEQKIILPYMNGIDSSLKFKPGLDDVSPEPARKPVRRLSGGRVSRQRSRERQRCGTRNFGSTAAQNLESGRKPARRRARKADIVAEHAA